MTRCALPVGVAGGFGVVVGKGPPGVIARGDWLLGGSTVGIGVAEGPGVNIGAPGSKVEDGKAVAGILVLVGTSGATPELPPELPVKREIISTIRASAMRQNITNTAKGTYDFRGGRLRERRIELELKDESTEGCGLL